MNTRFNQYNEVLDYFAQGAISSDDKLESLFEISSALFLLSSSRPWSSDTSFKNRQA
jgi:hypothetical protein